MSKGFHLHQVELGRCKQPVVGVGRAEGIGLDLRKQLSGSTRKAFLPIRVKFPLQD